MKTDHEFTKRQHAEYDLLSAKGRTAYDHSRWYSDASHDEAFVMAVAEHGFKSVELLNVERGV